MTAERFCVCGHEASAHVQPAGGDEGSTRWMGGCVGIVVTPSVAPGWRGCPCAEYVEEPESRRLERLGSAVAPRLLP